MMNSQKKENKNLFSRGLTFGILGTVIVVFFVLFLAPDFTEAASLVRPANNLGLIGYWSLNEGRGASTTDFSGNSNHGVLYPGPSGTITASSSMWIDGKRGKALNFDGTDDYVSVPHRSNHCPTTVTYALWVKKEATQNNIAPRALWKSPDSPRIFYSSQTTNVMGFIYQLTTSGGTGRNIGTTPPGVWTHVAFTYDGSTFYTYINGVLTNTYSVTDTAASCSGALKIGGESTREFAGSLDDVRIYNRALSASDISALYRSSSSVRKVSTKRGLIAHYSFDEGAGTVLGDYSGNKRDTTLANTDSKSGGWVDGKKGKAFMFDGGDDQATLSSTVYSNVSNTQGTIMGWAYPTTTCSNCFVVWGFGGTDSRYYINWAGDSRTLQVYRGTITDVIVLKSGAELNKWYHLAVTWEGGNVFSGYLNGAFVSSTTFSGDGVAPTSMLVGRQESNPGFTGALDDIKIFDRTLSASEIKADYSETALKKLQANNAGLVGHWSFEDGRGATSTDFSGKSNHGVLLPGTSGDNTASSSMWVNARLGRGINFDGTDDAIKLTSDVLGTGDITIATWIKADSYGAGNLGRIIDNGQTRLLVDSASGNKFIFTSDAATNASGADNSVRLGEWQFVVVTRTSAGVANIYVNGVLNSTADQSSGTPVAPSGTTYIGNNSNPGTRSFDGIIDDVRVYNRILSASEVSKLYKSR